MQLDLFHLDEISPGSPFWHPKGMVIFNTLEDLRRRENAARGYVEVKTPLIYDKSLWEKSGHWEKFREHMFLIPEEDHTYSIKPMNCPGHMWLFASTLRSYRELPLRYAEAAPLHRNELIGALHGLTRVRHITQDDAHIFCTREQIEDEIFGCIDYAAYLYGLFELEAKFELSTRPDNKLGSDEEWDFTEGALRAALERRGIAYTVNEGDGAFYGPKIDLHMTDSIGRSWQLGTVQLDYAMPERFDLAYTGADNAEHRPVLIHRALLGSFERFTGIMIEHYTGEFPLWLAPVQAIVMPVSDRFNDYAAEVRAELLEAGLRVELDERSESVPRKVREAELRKIPYMLVVGAREQGDRTVSVREHRGADLGSESVQNFAGRLQRKLYSGALRSRQHSERDA